MARAHMDSARIRSGVVVAGITFSGLAFVAWTQPWLTVSLVDGTTVEVSGDAAAPGLAALSLAALAVFASLAIAGPGVGTVLAFVAIAIGMLVASSGIGACADPLSAATSAVTSATGVAGANSLATLIESIVSTPWGVVAIVAGACLVLTGIGTLATSRRWPRANRKYSALGPAAQPPSTGQIVSKHNSRQQDRPEIVASRSSIDDWDSLSKGDDPTRR